MGPYTDRAELRHAGFGHQHGDDAELEFTALP
jgi:hypothetical protein